jgi:O-antigen ligase
MSLSPTLPHREGDELGFVLRGAVFLLALLLVWISPTPFAGEGEVALEGNIVNQIAFSTTALLCVGAMMLVDRRVLRAYAIPAYGLLVAWLALAVVTSTNFPVSLRAFMFTTVVITIAASIMVMPRDERSFALMFGGAAAIVLALCYAGLILFPEQAMHSSDSRVEPEHAGAWRGLFDHKNITGAMMGVFVMIGLFAARAGYPVLGWSVAVAAFVFLFFTKSKTTMALTPFVLLWALFAHRLESRWLRPLVCLGPLLLLLTFTVGSVLLPPVKALLEVISPGQTFTGRTEIWDFAFDRLSQRRWLGYGFEGFWGSQAVTQAEVGEFETGISQGMVHGHNSYVDAVVTLGLPGLALVLYVLVWRPLVDHGAAKRFAENDALTELFVRIWLFTAYSACLESFFFRRSDPVWFCMLLSVLGLRLVATWRVKA